MINNVSMNKLAFGYAVRYNNKAAVNEAITPALLASSPHDEYRPVGLCDPKNSGGFIVLYQTNNPDDKLTPKTWGAFCEPLVGGDKPYQTKLDVESDPEQVAEFIGEHPVQDV